MKVYLLIKTTRKNDDDAVFGPFKSLEGAQNKMRELLYFIKEKDELELHISCGSYFDAEDGFEIVERELIE